MRALATVLVPPTPTRLCTLRWGGNAIETYGNLTQQECANRGN